MSEKVYKYRHSVFNTVARSANPNLGAEWVRVTGEEQEPKSTEESTEDLIGEDGSDAESGNAEGRGDKPRAESDSKRGTSRRGATRKS